MPSLVNKNFLIFNLAVDESDPVLGFAVPLIARIAREAESVRVITVRTGSYTLPANVSVRSIGREKGIGRLAAVFIFYRHLFAALRETRPDICFSHMNPLFVALAGPFLRMRGTPVILWYSHRHRGIATRIAHYFAKRVVTSVREGYASSNPKVTVMGHMVDTDLFSPAVGALPISPPLFISVGRIAPIKDLMTFVRAAGIIRDIGHDVRFACVGPVLPYDTRYYRSLQEEVRRLSLEDRFIFTGPVPYRDVVSQYRRAFAHVNLCSRGSFDKAVIEAMACGTPSVAGNEAYGDLFGPYARRLLFRYGDALNLADILIRLLAEPPAALHAMRTGLRGVAVARGSMDSFLARLRETVSSVCPPV